MFHSRERLLRRVDDYLSTSFTAESSPRVSELAESLGITASQLGKIFHRVVGVRLSEYLKLRQLSHAETLLRETPFTVTQIAYKAGFGTRRTFFRAYKRVRGDTPDHYRHRARRAS